MSPSDLPNSRRRFYKSTYVPIRIAAADARRALGDALPKMSYVRSLNPTADEVSAVQQRMEQQDRQLTDSQQTMLATLSELNSRPSPLQMSALMPRLATVARDDLLLFGRSLIDVRKSAASPSGNAEARGPAQQDDLAYAITLTQLFAQRAIDPVGRMHLERLEMTPVDLARGELLYSLPLAPKETVNITHKEWSTVEEEFERYMQDQLVDYSERGVAEKNDMAMSTDSQSRHANVLSLSANRGGSYLGTTLSAAVDHTAPPDDAQAQTDSRAATQGITRQASARTIKEHKVSFKVASASGVQDESVRVINNLSDKQTMRIDYYRLMRKWRTDLYRYGLRMTYDIVIPDPGFLLRQRQRTVAELDALINQSFSFPLTPAGITRDNWTQRQQDYQVTLPTPPKPEMSYPIKHDIPFIDENSAETRRYETIEFDVDGRYVVSNAKQSFNYDWWNPDYAVHIDCMEDDTGEAPKPTTHDELPPFISRLTGLIGQTGHLSVTYRFRNVSVAHIEIDLDLRLTDDAFADWQRQAWAILRDAATAQFFQRRDFLRAQRDRLQAQIAQDDALTLRRMEREQIMRSVLSWLLPGFNTNPLDLALHPPPTPDPGGDPTTAASDPSYQQPVLEYGEFVKFIHQAIEWENVNYLLYPYFWDDQEKQQEKLYFDHADPQHREFLRAGAARVVLTIRPGFEADFAALIDQGVLGTLPQDHPYRTIAQDIQTANQRLYPEVRGKETEDDPHEPGIKIGSWYDYTPTSALDLAVKMGDIDK